MVAEYNINVSVDLILNYHVGLAKHTFYPTLFAPLSIDTGRYQCNIFFISSYKYS